MFKKLVKSIAAVKTEADRNGCFAQIDRAFDAEKISWDDHETLYNLASMVKVEGRTMKRYEVSVYNTADRFWDSYQVNATDPIDARNVAVQRLVDETGHGLDINEITNVREVKD